MNCEEFRSHISEGKYAADTEAVQHFELCAECRSLAHADHSLRQCLAAVRESAPQIPAALDASVIAAYRATLAGRATVSKPMRILRPLVWSAVAASVLVVAILALTRRQPISSPQPVTAHASPPSTVTTESAKILEKMPSIVPVRHPATRGREGRKRPATSTERPIAVAARATPNNGFQNLMFCDPLSCPGPMQVIRIQVPASAINRVPAWRPNGGMVQADVVVGPDGIARAIRIVR